MNESIPSAKVVVFSLINFPWDLDRCPPCLQIALPNMGFFAPGTVRVLYGLRLFVHVGTKSLSGVDGRYYMHNCKDLLDCSNPLKNIQYSNVTFNVFQSPKAWVKLEGSSESLLLLDFGGLWETYRTREALGTGKIPTCHDRLIVLQVAFFDSPKVQ